MNTPLTLIETHCRALAAQRGQLRKKFEARQKAINNATRNFDAEIRALQNDCHHTRAALLASVSVGRDLFVKPKTREFAGITVGFVKAHDTLTLPDDALLVDRIERLLPAKQAETVLDRSVKIIKDAFKKLPRELLQQLGCSVVSGADKPVIRANDDDIETLVQRSLGDSGSGTGVSPVSSKEVPS
jgi:hypothetical protein